MIVTDLDGTLLNSDHFLSTRNRKTLTMLEEQKIVRVVATGRVLYSAKKVLSTDFPIDYLIFSSGAGIINFSDGTLLKTASLTQQEVSQATDVLLEKGLSFMLHAPAPDNHFCVYKDNNINEDFARRLKLYSPYATKWSQRKPQLESWEYKGSIIVISVLLNEAQLIQSWLQKRLPNAKIIRCSSPLSREYCWIEIIPQSTSKAIASQWLKQYLNLDVKTMAIGNDFNDVDLLDWADHSFIVQNAPKQLRDKYKNVKTNNEDGFSEAVESYLTY